MWNLGYGTNEPIYRAETDSKTWRLDLWLLGGRERDGLGVWGWERQTIKKEKKKTN